MPKTTKPITVTWAPEGEQPYIWVIPAEIVASLEAYLDTQKVAAPATVKGPDGQPRASYLEIPKYKDVGSFVIQTLVETVVAPILEQHPPAELQSIMDAAKTAKARVDEVKAQMAANFLVKAS